MKHYYTLTMTRTGEVINAHETWRERAAFISRHNDNPVKISPSQARAKLEKMHGQRAYQMLEELDIA